MPLDAALYQQILESAPDALLLCDAQGRIVFANAQVRPLLGYEPQELQGAALEQLVPERFRSAHAAHRARFMADSRTRPMGSGLELYARHRDGHDVAVEISLSPIASPQGPLVAASIRDVTEQRRQAREIVAARNAARAALESQSRVLAAASHDLRQPVQALTFLNHALERLVQDPQARELVEQQHRVLQNAAGLLNRLLDISRLESAQLPVQKLVQPLAPLVEDIAQEFAPLAAAKGLQLQVEVGDHAVLTDPGLLGQMLRNLLSNAIKYTTHGSVRLRATSTGATVRL
ncbi:MAG: PAS domain-containing sensor histidine kinase, partial [Steroidobacteraceae bacterium]|nr:PAS domain-containing sensor histidine kinase [Steroidobacteraceae bacterium]MDW8257820.1 PAS domain-containing sensor histidine kinase [Gammaproteobacteria bacterium]